jgi:hypothetical protein
MYLSDKTLPKQVKILKTKKKLGLSQLWTFIKLFLNFNFLFIFEYRSHINNILFLRTSDINHVFQYIIT